MYNERRGSPCTFVSQHTKTMFRNVIWLIGVQDASTLAVNGMEYELDECLVLEFIGYGLFYVLGVYLSLEIQGLFKSKQGHLCSIYS